MGLMDMLGGALSGNSGNASGGGMLESVLGMVTQHSGGLNGLVAQLKAAGLDKQVMSWVGTGDNLPVSADQIKDALGHTKVAEIAKATGVSNDQAASGLAQHLPDIINQLTPDGKVPQGDLAAQAMAMLKSKFFGG